MSESKLKYTIYMHKNKINNKIYIGQTSRSVEERWRKNGYGYRTQPKFYNAILKYGWDNFEHIILETGLSKEEADKKEVYWIAYYDSMNNGYNLCSGGNKNKVFSDEVKQHLSDVGKTKIGEKNNFYGHKHTEESKATMNDKKKKYVLCKNTGHIFFGLKEAAEWAKVNKVSIGDCCRGKTKTSGVHPETGERLLWQYVEEPIL